MLVVHPISPGFYEVRDGIRVRFTIDRDPHGRWLVYVRWPHGRELVDVHPTFAAARAAALA